MAAGPSVLEEVSWQERAFVTITEKGNSDIDFHGIMSEMDFSGGAKDVEGQPLMNGGRFTEYSSQEDFEFSATLYITGADASQGSGISDYFHGSDDQIGDSGKFEYETTLNRSDFRIAVLFTDDDNVTSAVDSVSSDHSGYRWVATGAKLTSYEQSFDDQVLKVEVTFVIPPFDDSGSSQVKEQEIIPSATADLSALGSYT